LRRGGVRAALDAGIGFVPRDRHDEGLIPEMSVADNATLTVPHRLGHLGLLSRRTRDSLADKAIADLGIKTESPAQSVAELSGGNQQKVVFARALATDPAVLLLDEPTAGMNPQETEAARQLIFRIRDLGISVVVIEHDTKFIFTLCDQVSVLVQGELLVEGTPDVVRGDPRVVEAYLGKPPEEVEAELQAVQEGETP
jgi:ABC-type sugar transport system ATPase subunit